MADDATAEEVASLRRQLATALRMATAGGMYRVEQWTGDVRHADPCDCDEDDDSVGEACAALCEWVPTVVVREWPVLTLPKTWRPDDDRPDYDDVPDFTALCAAAARADALADALWVLDPDHPLLRGDDAH